MNSFVHFRYNAKEVGVQVLFLLVFCYNLYLLDLTLRMKLEPIYSVNIFVVVKRLLNFVVVLCQFFSSFTAIILLNLIVAHSPCLLNYLPVVSYKFPGKQKLLVIYSLRLINLLKIEVQLIYNMYQFQVYIIVIQYLYAYSVITVSLITFFFKSEWQRDTETQRYLQSNDHTSAYTLL